MAGGRGLVGRLGRGMGGGVSNGYSRRRHYNNSNEGGTMVRSIF